MFNYQFMINLQLNERHFENHIAKKKPAGRFVSANTTYPLASDLLALHASLASRYTPREDDFNLRPCYQGRSLRFRCLQLSKLAS